MALYFWAFPILYCHCSKQQLSWMTVYLLFRCHRASNPEQSWCWSLRRPSRCFKFFDLFVKKEFPNIVLAIFPLAKAADSRISWLEFWQAATKKNWVFVFAFLIKRCTRFGRFRRNELFFSVHERHVVSLFGTFLIWITEPQLKVNKTGFMIYDLRYWGLTKDV